MAWSESYFYLGALVLFVGVELTDVDHTARDETSGGSGKDGLEGGEVLQNKTDEHEKRSLTCKRARGRNLNVTKS